MYYNLFTLITLRYYSFLRSFAYCWLPMQNIQHKNNITWENKIFMYEDIHRFSKNSISDIKKTSLIQLIN